MEGITTYEIILAGNLPRSLLSGAYRYSVV